MKTRPCLGNLYLIKKIADKTVKILGVIVTITKLIQKLLENLV